MEGVQGEEGEIKTTVIRDCGSPVREEAKNHDKGRT